MKASLSPSIIPFAASEYQSKVRRETLEARPEQADFGRPPLGKWFDPSIDLRDPEGDLLTRTVVDKIEAARQLVKPRKRNRKTQDVLNQRQLVRAILANGLACHFHRDPPLVAYSRSAAFYANEPRWLTTKALASTIDLMGSIDLVSSNVGEWGCVSSTYSLTQSLLELSEQAGLSRCGLSLKLPSERLVRLRETNSDGPEVAFEQNAEIEDWIKQLTAYNAFVKRHDLAVEPSEWELAGWLSKINSLQRDGKPRLIRPELFSTSLYRTFNNASFEEGGRLYGGWWIGVPKTIRPKITIDGKPTVEADYSGCAIRMIYHEKGIDYRDDPYIIAPLVEYAEQNGLAPDHFREGVKHFMQALLNGDKDGAPERAKIEGFTFKPFTRREVKHMVEKTHPNITDAFGDGSGLRLQKKDSDLALTIIKNLMEKGILALPIHDSFLVQLDYKNELIQEMNNCYFNVFGFYPVLKINGNENGS